MGIKDKIFKIKNILNFDYSIAQGNIENIKKDIEELSNRVKLLNDEVSSLKNETTSLSNDMSLLNGHINHISNIRYFNPELLQLNNNNYTGKKRVLVCGFYGAVNLGDDLMLETLLSIIDEKKDFDITIMLCDNPYIDITKYGDYKFIHYPAYTTDFNIIADHFDVMIFGGGAVLDDVNYELTEKQISLGRILVDLSMRFITFNKKVILYGLSTNTKLINQDYIKKLNFIINNCTYFALRDTNSLNVLKSSNIDIRKVNIVDDIVMANHYKIKESRNNNILDIGAIFICNEETIETIIKYLRQLIKFIEKEKKKYHITLIPFYNYNDNDNKFYEQVLTSLNNKNVIISDFPNNMKELENIFYDKDYIISMRYHATLIANIMQKKVLNIIYSRHPHYDNKMKYIYEEYNYENNNIIFGEKIKETNLKKLFNNNINHNGIDRREKAKKDIINIKETIISR